MKQACLAALAAAILTFALPAFALERLPIRGAEDSEAAEETRDEETSEAGESEVPAETSGSGEGEPEDEKTLWEDPDPREASIGAEPMSGALTEDSYDDSIALTLLTGEEQRELTLGEYLTGVVAGELTDAFSDEALRAQAVAARTYALGQLEAGKHDGALCGDPGCCQSWTDPAEKSETAAGEDLVRRARQAVRDTDGQVLTYEGALIEALYFSCSGGRTEAAGDVWGKEIAYLQAVDSPGEESLAPRYETRVCFTPGELQELLASEGADLSGDPGAWLGEETRTEGGGVAALTVGGQALSGTRLRSLLGLNSTSFTASWDGQVFTFVTRGFGHRVGLSQYGAQAMALEGSTYREILAHYYPGTELLCLSPGDAIT